MRIIAFMLSGLLIFLFSACTSSPTSKVHNNISDTLQKENFFPVTNYIRGEIFSIKNSGINPRLFVTEGNKTDTTLLKVEAVDSAVAPFLTPLIDTVNLKNVFSETSFFDQTLNNYTFTYSRKENNKSVPELISWTVYLNPNDNKVSGINIEKEPGPGIKQLLTWKAGISSKIVTIRNDTVIKEDLIKWNYDEDGQ